MLLREELDLDMAGRLDDEEKDVLLSASDCAELEDVRPLDPVPVEDDDMDSDAGFRNDVGASRGVEQARAEWKTERGTRRRLTVGVDVCIDTNE